MKKSLFLLASIGAFALVNAQTVFVKANTDVKVKPGALFYVDGNVKVDKYTEDGKKFSNEGMVKITTNLETSTDADAKTSFVDEHTSVGKYGQLIVKNGTANVGKIASVVKTPSGFSFLPLAIPYSGITADDVVTQLFGSSDNAFPGYHGNPGYHGGFDKNRLKNAIFVWNNDKYRFDNLGASDKIGESSKEANYYAINTNYSSVGKLAANSVKDLKGVPNNAEFTVTLTKYDLKDKKNTDVNKYGEAFGSYIIDFTESTPSSDWTDYYRLAENGVSNGTDFGSRIYNLGNPYTSNINLNKLSEDSSNSEFLKHIKALVQYGSQDYTDAINKSSVSGSKGKSDYQVATYSATTANGTGDVALAIVAPFQTFAVKMDESMPSTVSVKFTDKVKTFDGPTASGQALVNTMFNRAKGSFNSKVNQVGLDLYDASNNNTGARTYVVASDIYDAAEKGKGVELYNVAMNDKSMGIYTLQENEDGTINSEDRTYINGVNADKYIAKPIHLVVQNGKGTYTLKARLNDDLKNNKNTFYFEDKKTGKVQKIGSNFSYTFTANGTDKDRFVLYWASTPKISLDKDLAKEVENSIVVYKAGSLYKVRFDKSMKKADVFVYNISGQLVNVAKSVDTTNDYVVPVKGNSSVYIVKVVADNGTVVSKKIIK